MKQKYLSPELEITLLSAEDILTASENEAKVPGDDGLFDGATE